MTDTLPAPTGTPAVEPGWVIKWRGHAWSDSDITGQHLAVLSLIAGTDAYDELDIDPRHGHQRLMMMIAACVTVEATRGMDESDPEAVADAIATALNVVQNATAEEILAALELW